jgi:hypothetical protein
MGFVTAGMRQWTNSTGVERPKRPGEGKRVRRRYDLRHDVKVLLPEDGIIRVESLWLFGEPDGPRCRRFVERAFLAPEIDGVVIAAGSASAIELRFDATQRGQRQVLEHLAELLIADDRSHERAPCDGAADVPPVATARDRHGVVRYHRYARRITGWRVTCERVGMITLENPALYRKAVLCEAIERELMSVLGVDRYETNSRNGRAKIEYDPRQLGPAQIIEILDGALANAEHPDELDKPELELALCTASIPLAAIAQFAIPALLPISAALFAYTSFPSFRRAYQVLTKERRLGVDVLDSIVVLGCLASLQVSPARSSLGAWHSAAFWCAAPRTVRKSFCSGRSANSRAMSGWLRTISRSAYRSIGSRRVMSSWFIPGRWYRLMALSSMGSR